jgi:hypothetical protein
MRTDLLVGDRRRRTARRQSVAFDQSMDAEAGYVRIPTKAATYSNLIAATIPI